MLNVSSERCFHECLECRSYNTHSLGSYPNINIRFISEAYLSGTKTVVIKFMGYVGITAIKPQQQTFSRTQSSPVQQLLIGPRNAQECPRGLLRLV